MLHEGCGSKVELLGCLDLKRRQQPQQQPQQPHHAGCLQRKNQDVGKTSPVPSGSAAVQAGVSASKAELWRLEKCCHA